MSFQQNTSIPAILLAAGQSSRMGQPKQLLPFQQTTLLGHAAEQALAAGLSPVVVVLGAYAAQCEAVLTHLPVERVLHAQWEQGMGSSLKAGLRHLLRLLPAPPPAVVAMVCDQPALQTSHLQALVRRWQATHPPLVASRYGEVRGVPMLLAAELFEEVYTLDDHTGAKPLIQKYAERLAEVFFAEGTHDVDTPADYARWSAK